MTQTKTIFLFTGQGSQYRGMGQKLYEQNEIFKASLLESEAVFKQNLGRSLIKELYEEKEPFDDLLVTHPAIVAVEIALLQVLQSMKIKPDLVLGHSLGEFAAAVAAGILSPTDAIETAIEQAKTLVRCNIEGGMLAVIDHKRESLEALFTANQLFLASDNFEGHFTVSGRAENLDQFEKELKERKIQYLRLPVNCPFHSPLLEDAELYATLHDTCEYNTPTLPFLSGLEAKELKTIPQNYFWKSVSTYFNFTEGLNYCEKLGDCLYIDIGPSGTAATFVKHNLSANSNSQSFTIMSPFKRELEQLQKLEQMYC